MSYILQALQKAATDRQRGQVPDLHQAMDIHQGNALGTASGTRRRWVIGASAAVLVLLLVVGVTTLSTDHWRAKQAELPETDAMTAKVPSVIPAPTVASAELMAASNQTPGQPPLEPLAPDTVFKASAPILRPAPPPEPTATPEPSVNALPAQTASVAAATPGDVAGLSISGATYSDNPAHRMLIVNGQVVREGQAVKPGLTLEAISPNSAIFNQGGRRFNLNY